MSKTETKFDLEDRTTKFGIDAIHFLKDVPRNPITLPIITQLIRSSTSIGANYAETNNAYSRADFKHKISICRKEARESVYWLKIIKTFDDRNTGKEALLEKEAHELTLIFNAIVNKVEINNKLKNLVIT